MTPAQIGLSGLLALIFAAWAYVAFRALFRLAALLRYRSGKMIPGLAETLAAPKVFLTDHHFRKDRKYLGLMTLLLLILSAVFARRF